MHNYDKLISPDNRVVRFKIYFNESQNIYNHLKVILTVIITMKEKTVLNIEKRKFPLSIFLSWYLDNLTGMT